MAKRYILFFDFYTITGYNLHKNTFTFFFLSLFVPQYTPAPVPGFGRLPSRHNTTDSTNVRPTAPVLIPDVKETAGVPDFLS